MHHTPDFIIEILKKYSGDNPEERFQLIMDSLPQHEDEKDIVHAWAITTISHRRLEERVIRECRRLLPLTQDHKCIKAIRNCLIGAYEDLGQTENMLDAWHEMERENGLDCHECIDLANVYEKMGNIPKAIAYYEEHVAQNNGNCDYETFTELAELYDKNRDYKQAAKYFESAGRILCWEGDWLWQRAGRALALSGQEEEALFYFKMAQKINPEEAMNHYYIGQVLQNQGDIYRAMHHYMEALKIDPGCAAVYNNLGSIAYNEDSNISEAIEKIEKALSVNDDQDLMIKLYRNLAMLYSKISDYDKAEYYKMKMMEALGFPFSFAEMGEGEEDDDDYLDDEDLEGLDLGLT